MKKVLEFLKNFFSKRINIIICAVVLVVFAVGICIVSASSNQAKKLEKELKAYAKIYYEEVYYDLISEDTRDDFLSTFTTIGIKADLENLVRAIDGVEGVEPADKIFAKFVNKKTGESCNKAKTKVIIYPTDPYKKTNYNIEVNLECGFETK